MELPVRQRPLGVEPAIVLTDAQARTLRALQDYDLTPVRDRLLRDAAMPAGWVDEAILEFRRYLGLRVLEPERLLMFSKPVDNVWHTCLLFSRLYMDLCHRAFGEFVHHEPATSPEPDLGGRWTAFRSAYERNYGPLNRLWRGPSDHD